MAAYETDKAAIMAAVGLDCDSCPGGDVCRQRARDSKMLSSGGWKICPEAASRMPSWQVVIRLFNAKHVSPLSEWPAGWAAWVADGLQALQTAVDKKQAAEAKELSRGSRKRQNVLHRQRSL